MCTIVRCPRASLHGASREVAKRPPPSRISHRRYSTYPASPPKRTARSWRLAASRISVARCRWRRAYWQPEARPEAQMPGREVMARGGIRSAAPFHVYGKVLPVRADCVTMPEKAIMAIRPLASSCKGMVRVRFRVGVRVRVRPLVRRGGAGDARRGGELL